METRSIEIDFEIHKLIETERRSFSEPPAAALRRLLKLGQVEPPREAPSTDEDTSGAWSGKGVVLPAGTKLRMEYRGQQYFGEVIDSMLVVNGKRYVSPSGAASGSAVTKDGKHPVLGGWKYWYVKRPQDVEWTLISDLRPSK